MRVWCLLLLLAFFSVCSFCELFVTVLASSLLMFSFSNVLFLEFSILSASACISSARNVNKVAPIAPTWDQNIWSNQLKCLTAAPFPLHLQMHTEAFVHKLSTAPPESHFGKSLSVSSLFVFARTPFSSFSSSSSPLRCLSSCSGPPQPSPSPWSCHWGCHCCCCYCYCYYYCCCCWHCW